MKDQFTYAATDDLYAFESMKNYNNFIAKIILRGLKKAGIQGKSILDFGAGIGTLSQIIKQQSGLSPIALEIDQSQATIIAERGFAVYSNMQDVPDNLDACFTSNVLEHIEDDKAALRSIATKMKSNGAIAIFVPAFHSLWTEMDDEVGHFRRYTKQSLSAVLKESGFDVVKVQYCDSLGYIVVRALKWLGSRRKAETNGAMGLYDRVMLPISLWLDNLGAKYLFGKNVFAVATKSL